MKWLDDNERSFSVLVLTVGCILTTILWIVITIEAFKRRMYIMGSPSQMSHIILTYTMFWSVATTGIIRLRRWGWVLVLGIGLFSLVSSANLFLSQSVGNKSLPGFGIVLGIAFILILNIKSVRIAYKVESVRGNRISEQFIFFAIICITTGIFLFFELVTGFRIASGTIVTRLFVSIIGLVFVLLGFGIRKLNAIAMQAVEPVLIFMLISVGLIFGKDYFDSSRYFPPMKSVCYIALIGALIIYWRSKLRLKVDGFIRSQNLKKE